MDTWTPDPAAAEDNASAAAADTGGTTGVPSTREGAVAPSFSDRNVRGAIQRGDVVARKPGGWDRISPAARDGGADRRRTPSAAGCGRPPPRGG